MRDGVLTKWTPTACSGRWLISCSFSGVVSRQNHGCAARALQQADTFDDTQRGCRHTGGARCLIREVTKAARGSRTLNVPAGMDAEYFFLRATEARAEHNSASV